MGNNLNREYLLRFGVGVKMDALQTSLMENQWEVELVSAK